MYKQPTIPSVRSASRCGPKLFVFALVCPSIRNKARDSLVVACLKVSRSGSMAAQAHSPPTLRSLSRQSLRRDGAPLTHRARQRKPAWAVANTSKCCLQTASNSRPGVNVSRRARLCARLVPAHTPQPHKSQSSPRRVRGMHIWQVPQSLPAGAAPRRPAPRAVTTGSSAAGWPQRARNGGC